MINFSTNRRFVSFVVAFKIHSLFSNVSKFWIKKIIMTRAILIRCSFRFFLFVISRLRLEIITWRNCCIMRENFVKNANLIRVWIVDFAINLLISSFSFEISLNSSFFSHALIWLLIEFRFWFQISQIQKR